MLHQPIVESLETRRLFAGAALKDSVIRVNGDVTSKNTITVSETRDTLDVTIAYKDATGISYSSTTSFPTTLSYRKINIYGGIRNDTITVATVKTTRIDAGRGNDTLILGAERDVVIAGSGNDTVDAGAKNDLVYGGEGDDVLTGGDGDDTLLGGDGQDSIDGGAGDDTLGATRGVPNTVTGGAGADQFFAVLALNPSNDFDDAEDSVGQDEDLDINGPPAVTPL